MLREPSAAGEPGPASSSPSPLAAAGWKSAALVTTAALAMQAVVWTTLYDVFGIARLGYGFFDVSDLPYYFATYVSPLARGLLPYRDFFLEYPPLCVPLFAATGLGADQATFQLRFAALMAAMAAAACAVTALAADDDAESERPFLVAALSSLATLLLGPIAANRFDAAVALVLALVLLAMARRRWVAVAALIGLGFAVKVTPAMLLPLVLLVAPQAVRRRMAAAFAAAAFLPFLPFLMLGGSAGANLARLFSYHLARPLEIESIAATPFWIAKLAGITSVNVDLVAGSQVIVSPLADLVAKSSGLLLLAALGCVLALVWRRRRAIAADSSLQFLAVLALLLASFAGSKVLSPQYFVWVIPVVSLVAVERRLLGALVAASLLLTQVFFPANYWSFARDQATTAVALVVLRNFVVVAAFALSLRHLWTLPASPSR